jgi:dipeptidyl aminopeptidase/acylaminoacyl peptidase
MILSALLVSAALTQAPSVALIPRELLLGNPERTAPRISPDGKQLSWLAPDSHGVLQVWVKPVGAADKEANAVTRDVRRPVRVYEWAEDSTHLLYWQDAAGDENFHLFAVDLLTNNIRDLTPFDGVRASSWDTRARCPDTVLVSLNLRDRKAFDVYRVSLKTGSLDVDTQNPGDVVSWVVDSNCLVRGAEASLPDGGVELRVRDGAKAPWRSLVRVGLEETVALLGFTLDGKSAFVTTSIDTDTDRLVEKNLKTGSERVLAQNPKSDVREVMLHPTKFTAQAALFELNGRPEWTLLESGIRTDFELLKAQATGQWKILSRDRNDSLWIAALNSDLGPRRFWLWDRTARKATFLFSAQPGLEGLPLQSLEPTVIKARDGIELSVFLMRPQTGATNAPLVLQVHGGPWSRDEWGFDPRMQLLANRGYAVLKVNFRGSTGFGKRFLNAANKQWGAKMHDDLVDAVRWAVGEGYADPKKVCIYGASYGGYSALAGAAFTPDVFKCAVDVVGPSNLITLLAGVPTYWAAMRGKLEQRMGNPADPKDLEMLKRVSPLNSADKIRIPLLIGQGANDPRVKQAESEQIVAALEKNGLGVTYVLYPDEGHGFARPENNTDFMARTEAFLAENLGGRFEPMPKEGKVSGSTALVKLVKPRPSR